MTFSNSILLPRQSNPGIRRANLPHTRLRGFSLIEVMVAMLLLAGGLLGVAYMQNYSLQFGQESYNRSQIMVSANELIDGMRAFQISPDDGSGDSAFYTDPLTTTEIAAGCDPTMSTARNDMICFYQQAANNLPYGTANVTVNGSLFNISVFWSDRGLTEQADYSDESQSGGQINLSNATACNNAENRIWSAALTWPFDNAPATPQCLISHTWSIQVLNTSTL